MDGANDNYAPDSISFRIKVGYDYEVSAGAVSNILEGKQFWEDKNPEVNLDVEAIEKEIVEYTKTNNLNPDNTDDWDEIYNQTWEVLEFHYMEKQQKLEHTVDLHDKLTDVCKEYEDFVDGNTLENFLNEIGYAEQIAKQLAGSHMTIVLNKLIELLHVNGIDGLKQEENMLMKELITTYISKK